MTTIPALNLSNERQSHAVAWILGEGLLSQPVLESTRELAAVALLACDDRGAVRKDVLFAAMNDPSAVQAGRHLLAQARAQQVP